MRAVVLVAHRCPLVAHFASPPAGRPRTTPNHARAGSIRSLRNAANRSAARPSGRNSRGGLYPLRSGALGLFASSLPCFLQAFVQPDLALSLLFGRFASLFRCEAGLLGVLARQFLRMPRLLGQFT